MSTSKRAFLPLTICQKLHFWFSLLGSLSITKIYQILRRKQSRSIMQPHVMQLQLQLNDLGPFKNFSPFWTEIFRPKSARWLATQINIFCLVEHLVTWLLLNASWARYFFPMLRSSQTRKAFAWKARKFSLWREKKFWTFLEWGLMKRYLFLDRQNLWTESRSKYIPRFF